MYPLVVMVMGNVFTGGDDPQVVMVMGNVSTGGDGDE